MGMSHTKLSNPTIRQQQYVDAIRWYLYNTSFPILFVENSCHDFSREFTTFINSNRLEFITYDGNQYNRELGKGYGEACIIEYGLRHSRMICGSKEQCSIIKVTGRYTCKNIMELSKKCSRKDTVYANIAKDIYNGSNIAISNIFIAPLTFLTDFFLVGKGRLNDSKGYIFENLLYDSITRWKSSGCRFREFWALPLISGVSGTYSYDILEPSLLSRFKHKVMYLLHRFFGYSGYINPFRNYQ